MHTPLQFIFVGRLVEEKGFDLVLAMCEKIHKEGQLDKNIHIHIFGAGSFQDDLPTYDFVTYYGHQPKADILKVRETCHYTLMPSKFLETF
jgi:glycosyltransferase involved in cell wall biosynthesis